MSLMDFITKRDPKGKEEAQNELDKLLRDSQKLLVEEAREAQAESLIQDLRYRALKKAEQVVDAEKRLNKKRTGQEDGGVADGERESNPVLEAEALARLNQIQDPVARKEAIDLFYTMQQTKTLPKEWVAMLAIMKGARGADGGSNPSSTTQQAVDTLKSVIDVLKSMGWKAPNEVSPPATSSPDPFTEKAKEYATKVLDKALESQINPPKPDNKSAVPLKDLNVAVPMEPEQAIEYAKAMRELDLKEKEVDANREQAKGFTDLVKTITEPLGEVGASLITGAGKGGNAQRRQEKMEDGTIKNSLPCPTCLALKPPVETIISVYDAKDGQIFRCPRAKELHPDKETLRYSTPPP